MKIIGPEDSGKIGFKPIQKKDGIKGGQDFSKILSEESDKIKGAATEKARQANVSAAPKFPSHISMTSLDPAEKTGEAVNREKLIAMTEKVLSQLEFLKSALENPKVEMSKFSPLVDSLKNDAKSLEKATAKTPDVSLKNLADEAATLAATESLKFYRGDYG